MEFEVNQVFDGAVEMKGRKQMMKRREMCRMNAEQSAGRDAEEDAGEKDETQEMMGRENRLV